MIVAALLLAAALPQDVARFVSRREDCNHYAGEDPYDPARARFLERMETRLNCDRIERDERQLRRRYRADRRVIRTLDRPPE